MDGKVREFINCQTGGLKGFYDGFVRGFIECNITLCGVVHAFILLENKIDIKKEDYYGKFEADPKLQALYPALLHIIMLLWLLLKEISYFLDVTW